MTDRVSKIILRASISDFQGKMVAAGKSVSDFGDKITNQDKKSQAFRKGLSSVGDAAGKMGLVAAAGLGVMVVASAKFDSSMSKVQAATHESAGSMEALRAAAIKAGADTAFSATEAADAITALSKAGVSTKDVLAGGLNGALSLASAGELDVAQSAEIAATAMTQFGLSGKDIPHIADLLAAGAGKAQGEVTDMAQALKYVGPVAHQMGISIEETTGTIAELASQGILADQAGTSLRGMLSSLTSPSKQAAAQMSALGITLYNAEGNFVGFNGVAGQLQKTMGGLSNTERDQALGRIFGNEQITAARILYAGGAQDVDKWTKAVNDQGYAAETAALKMDNLSGDFEKLKGSLSTLLITGGDGTQGFLRGVTQGAEQATNALNGLPQPAKNASVALLAITAVTGGALFLGAGVVSRVTVLREAITTLGIQGTTTARALGVMGTAAKGAGLALAAIALQDLIQGGGLDKSLPTLNELTNTLNKIGQGGGGSTKDLTKNFDDLGAAIERVGDPNKAQALQDSLAGMVGFGGGDDVKNYRNEITALDSALANIASANGAPAARAALAGLAKAKNLDVDQTQALMALLPSYRDALAGAASKIGDLKTATGGLTTATGGLTTTTADNTATLVANQKAIDAEIKWRDKLTQINVSAFDAETAYQRALADGKARKDDKGFVATLDASTKAGQANRDALSGMATAWNNLSIEQKDAKGAYAGARDDLIKQAMQFGATRKEARKYADDLLAVPHRITTRIMVEKQKAQAALKAFSDAFDGLDGRVARTFVRVQQDKILGPGGKLERAGGSYADGGFTGDGGKYEPAGVVHRGEFVIDAEQTMRHRALLEAIHRRAPGYATGGYVDQRAQRTQMRGYAAGGYVTGGPSVGIDYERLAGVLSGMRPLYGDVHVKDGTNFRRALQQDSIAASGGGVNF